MSKQPYTELFGDKIGGDWRVTAARYAKHKFAIHCESDGSGMKTRAMRIASTLKGARYSNREKAYIVSRKGAAQFVQEVKSGIDACVITGKRYIPGE